MKNFLKQQME
jgi:hypothetical protein